MNEEKPSELAEVMAMQRQLAELGLVDLEARYLSQPVTSVLVFGGGVLNEAEQTIPGNPDSPFHGVAILNPTDNTLLVGFNAGAAQMGQLQVPPYSGLVWPAQYVDLSIAVTRADAIANPAERISIARLPFPVSPISFPYGPELALFNVATGKPEPQRTPTVFIPLNVNLVKEGNTALWTPKAGKRFRLLGWSLELAETTTIILNDEATETGIVLTIAGAIPNLSPVIGNGYLSLLAGNKLNAFAFGAPTLHGFLFGTEE